MSRARHRAGSCTDEIGQRRPLPWSMWAMNADNCRIARKGNVRSSRLGKHVQGSQWIILESARTSP